MNLKLGLWTLDFQRGIYLCGLIFDDLLFHNFFVFGENKIKHALYKFVPFAMVCGYGDCC